MTMISDFSKSKNFISLYESFPIFLVSSSSSRGFPTGKAKGADFFLPAYCFAGQQLQQGDKNEIYRKVI